jgi:ubiquinone/menaquinone biosynthesis C-methylase UbiE
MDWNKAYETGDFKHWDFGGASSELVAVLATEGLPKQGEKALDIGCGGGWESIFLAKYGYEVTGVDLSPNALEIAKKRSADAGVTVIFLQGSALDLPVADQSIDFINDRGCFHVIQAEDRPQYAKEVLRVLKPGGLFLLRGCREVDQEVRERIKQVDAALADKVSFQPVTEEVVDRLFGAEHFARGPILPLKLMGGENWVPGNIVVLRRR